MSSVEDFDRQVRRPNQEADLLIEESTGRAIYCGWLVPLPDRSTRRFSKSFLLLRALCRAALLTGSPWVTGQVLENELWKPDEVLDTSKQLYTCRQQVKTAFGKLEVLHREGFRQVPEGIGDWILKGNARRLRINHSPEKIDIAWEFLNFTPEIVEIRKK